MLRVGFNELDILEGRHAMVSRSTYWMDILKAGSATAAVAAATLYGLAYLTTPNVTVCNLSPFRATIVDVPRTEPDIHWSSSWLTDIDPGSCKHRRFVLVHHFNAPLTSYTAPTLKNRRIIQAITNSEYDAYALERIQATPATVNLVWHGSPNGILSADVKTQLDFARIQAEAFDHQLAGLTTEDQSVLAYFHPLTDISHGIDATIGVPMRLEGEDVIILSVNGQPVFGRTDLDQLIAQIAYNDPRVPVKLEWISAARGSNSINNSSLSLSFDCNYVFRNGRTAHTTIIAGFLNTASFGLLSHSLAVRGMQYCDKANFDAGGVIGFFFNPGTKVAVGVAARSIGRRSVVTSTIATGAIVGAAAYFKTQNTSLSLDEIRDHEALSAAGIAIAKHALFRH
jgi:hypothetical protein